MSRFAAERLCNVEKGPSGPSLPSERGVERGPMLAEASMALTKIGTESAEIGQS